MGYNMSSFFVKTGASLWGTVCLLHKRNVVRCFGSLKKTYLSSSCKSETFI